MTIKHAFISPIEYLHLIPEESNFHLLLAHLLKDKAYSEFYRKRKAAGDFIIIDNGAFEFKRPLAAEEYYALVNDSGITPDVVVAPDYPNQPWDKTVKSTMHFLDEYTKYFSPETQVMAVPQSVKGDYLGWIKAYTEFALCDGIDYIGMSILGIPNAFCSITGTDGISFNRSFASVYLKNRQVINMNKKHHYLGCEDPRELLLQKEIGIAYSNDSSSAFWHAINGIKFDSSSSGLVSGKIKKEVDFDFPYDSSAEDAISHNVKWMSGILKSDT